MNSHNTMTRNTVTRNTVTRNTVTRLLVQVLFWIATESMLNVVGLDTLADYSEYLSVQHENATYVFKTDSSQRLYPDQVLHDHNHQRAIA